MLKGRLKKLEKALNYHEERIILLDEVRFYKEDGKYFEEATNGKEWIKYEIDPHKKLSDKDYKGKVVNKKGINENDRVIILMCAYGDSEDAGDEVYKETYQGETKILTEKGWKYAKRW